MLFNAPVRLRVGNCGALFKVYKQEKIVVVLYGWPIGVSAFLHTGKRIIKSCS
jgi:hypothetical protein